MEDSPIGDPTGVTATEAAVAATAVAIITTIARVAAWPSTPVPVPVAISSNIVMGDNVLDWVRNICVLVKGVEGVVATADDKDQGASLGGLEGALVSTSAFYFYFIEY